MDTELIERLLGLMEQSAMTEFEYDANGTRVRILKHHGKAVVVPSKARDEDTIETPTRSLDSATDSPAPVSAAGPHSINATLSGNFYRTPEPGAPPYVAVGDVVAEGDTLALIESMKLLNPVEADVAGRIVAIVPQDGETVEIGATLFLIEQAG
jgi:acetyl-CoA carboxylase biotin carboxyl carrier protein